MDTLLELAERCERATGPDRELDRKIAQSQGWTHFFVQKDMWWKSPNGSSHGDPPRYTASLDAAMSLVPEGALWHVNKWANGADASIAFTRPYRDGPRYTAATPALALCAAALRARANPRRKEG